MRHPKGTVRQLDRIRPRVKAPLAGVHNGGRTLPAQRLKVSIPDDVPSAQMISTLAEVTLASVLK